MEEEDGQLGVQVPDSGGQWRLEKVGSVQRVSSNIQATGLGEAPCLSSGLQLPEPFSAFVGW